MKVTFLNVGQGDSIILEWEKDSILKYGIIDCKSTSNGNPIISYLKKVTPRQIEFIILTHPHSDHYAGMFELLEYLTSNKITIKSYMHTGTVSPNRIKIAVKGPDESYELGKLYTYLYHLKETIGLKIYNLSEMPGEVALNSEWHFTIFSPSTTEYDRYSSGSKYSIIDNDEDAENENRGNFLSTFLVFFTDISYWVLTADCEVNTFRRIDEDTDYREFFNCKKLLLAQIPHHGSSKNYKSIFWKNKKQKKKYTPAVISVGKNKYMHPSQSVIDDLIKLEYSIYTTEPLSNFTNTIYKTDLFLNVLSPMPPSTNLGVKFSIDATKAKEIVF